MNLKKAKQLRQALRKSGINPAQKIMLFMARAKKDGSQLPGTFYLKKDCGRKVYQLAKQEAKNVSK